MLSKVKEYNNERLRLVKQAKLKMLESQLQLQRKQGSDERTIHQTMKDISKVRSELKCIK